MGTVEESFLRVIRLVRRLRAEDGCPWDRAHHFPDYLKMLIEEARELQSAIADGDPAEIRTELGDTLWNAIYLLVLAEDELGFPIQDVLHQSCEKIIARHPHVFGSAQARTPDEVLEIWQKVKEQEKRAKERERRHGESQRRHTSRAKPRPQKPLDQSPPDAPSSS
jgi:uncharacterized protein YabN with tetrapyrrole methylase and pyrophosphatase domain